MIDRSLTLKIKAVQFMQCFLYFTKLATSHSTWNMQKVVTIASIIIIITKIKSLTPGYLLCCTIFSHQDIPWDNRIVDQTVPKMISYSFNEFLKKFWAKLLITRSSLDFHMQVYTFESESTCFTYQVKFCLCVLWHISETSA